MKIYNTFFTIALFLLLINNAKAAFNFKSTNYVLKKSPAIPFVLCKGYIAKTNPFLGGSGNYELMNVVNIGSFAAVGTWVNACTLARLESGRLLLIHSSGVTKNTPKFKYSDDNGATWYISSFPNVAGNLSGSIIKASSSLLVSGVNVIFKSIDGGATWTTTSPTVNRVTKLPNSNTLVTLSTNPLKYSLDEGATWINSSLTGTSLTGAAVGVKVNNKLYRISTFSDGTVYSTIDGITWTNEGIAYFSAAKASRGSIYRNNKVYLVREAVYETTNGVSYTKRLDGGQTSTNDGFHDGIYYATPYISSVSYIKPTILDSLTPLGQAVSVFGASQTTQMAFTIDLEKDDIL